MIGVFVRSVSGLDVFSDLMVFHCYCVIERGEIAVAVGVESDRGCGVFRSESALYKGGRIGFVPPWGGSVFGDAERGGRVAEGDEVVEVGGGCGPRLAALSEAELCGEGKRFAGYGPRCDGGGIVFEGYDPGVGSGVLGVLMESEGLSASPRAWRAEDSAAGGAFVFGAGGRRKGYGHG